MAAFVNYYHILHIERSATTDQIRTAYKKESLRTHPDRLPPSSSPQDRASSTQAFQAVADAYYVLSDPGRRRDYDALLDARAPAGWGEGASASASFFEQFASAFASGASHPPPPESTTTNDSSPEPEAPPSSWSSHQPDPNTTFSNVFADLLTPEIAPHLPYWTWLGSLSGAGLGYIIGNVPGLMLGAYAGNRLGKVRDAKGKSVAEVFVALPGARKAEILKVLAMKILGSTLQ
ncbi:DnaJ-domain-containing protein [Dacryopinax primogenitus]|uniref:DnaJ-domain-containing protein n=1 Tax=Dacryopinax primogenitus (strain DJM 731) TaxID=1858805 RepID=M5FZB7_DACPD|nr:DnaJ-domain-containing protein [Dacryopinax primogenitus]EJU01859.1 DnaJ-domain-containing protein [Dacryopinax primogenitus]